MGVSTEVTCVVFVEIVNTVVFEQPYMGSRPNTVQEGWLKTLKVLVGPVKVRKGFVHV